MCSSDLPSVNLGLERDATPVPVAAADTGVVPLGEQTQTALEGHDLAGEGAFVVAGLAAQDVHGDLGSTGGGMVHSRTVGQQPYLPGFNAADQPCK